MNKKTLLLIIGGLLIALGLIKPEIGFLKNNSDIKIPSISKPTNTELLDECEQVAKILKSSSASSYDAIRLASLYMDISSLIELDGDDAVIKTTEEIRQANSLSGLLLRLNIKGKYPELASAAKSVIVASIGDDNVPLTKDLRAKAVESFRALAWACNEGAK